MKDNRFQVKSYYRKELAAFYRCHPVTFNKWLKMVQQDLGPCVGNYLSPKQVRIIVEKFGKP